MKKFVFNASVLELLISFAVVYLVSHITLKVIGVTADNLYQLSAYLIFLIWFLISGRHL